MAATKMKPCKVCGQEIAKSAKTCPYCGAKQKKGIGKIILIVLVVLVLLAVFGSSGGSTDQGPQKVDEVSGSAAADESAAEENTAETAAVSEETTAAPIQTTYKVGDILMDGDTEIVYAASGTYKEDNEFSQPAEGNKYIYLKLAFINHAEHDTSISFYSFECYADGYSAEMYYRGEDDLSATLSAGRAAEGYLYFEVPEDAQDIEVEYESNIFTNEKIHFVFEGDKDSGYVLEKNTGRTEGALAAGDTYEDDNLRINFLSAEVYKSDNDFIQPRDGYQFISVELEFENLSDSDQSVSTYAFDCYADGISCVQSFLRDDDLSATLSAGRKTRGTVTFEVPDNAEVVEAEYNDNVWTSHRIVFTVR